MAVKMLTGSLDKPDATIRAAGLGARDTLRLEAGMPLYGHELGEQGDPISAGLGWAVDLTKDFIGSTALRRSPPPARSESWSAWNWKAAESPVRERRSWTTPANPLAR